MNKKRIAALVLSCVILGQGVTISVLAEETTPHKIVAQTYLLEKKQEFGAHSNDGYYKYSFIAATSKGTATIDFEEPAYDFTLVLEDENGNAKLKQDFVRANNGEPVNHIKVEFDLTMKENYTFRMINNDSVNISGSVNLVV